MSLFITPDDPQWDSEEDFICMSSGRCSHPRCEERRTATLCSCGHAEGYHDARSLETDDQVEVCAVWACYCEKYEAA